MEPQQNHLRCNALAWHPGLPGGFCSDNRHYNSSRRGVVADAEGDRYGYMLTTNTGGSASLALVPDVGLPVTVTGQLEVRGDLTYLRIADNGVVRINRTAKVD